MGYCLKKRKRISMKYNIIYTEYKCKWKIAKVKDGYSILNHLDESIDTFDSFDEAYAYVNKLKDCK